MMMMDMDMDDTSLSSMVVKEERIDDFDEDVKFEPVKRGRTRSLTKKSADKVDIKAKLERSRQSARECRARKKLRYQYLEEIISETEKSIFLLRRELDVMKLWSKEMDDGRLPEHLVQYRTSCVEKKLTMPFKLQQHHHIQIAQQRQEAAMSPQQHSTSSTSSSSGGICISPSAGVPMRSLSLSPSGQMSPYMTALSRSPQMTSPGAYSVSPP